MRIFLLALALIVSVSCAARGHCTQDRSVCSDRPFSALPPETPVPSSERLQKLLAGPMVTSKELPFRIDVYPRMILAGSAARVTCFVPRTYERGRTRLRMGIDLVGTKELQLDLIETRMLFESLPCGKHPAFCQLLSWDNEVIEQRSDLIEVKGGMCGEGQS